MVGTEFRGWKAYLVVFLVLAAASFFLTSSFTGLVSGISLPAASDTSSDTPKVVLIVHDGAEWRVINTLQDQGRLSTYKAMMEEGSYTHLVTPNSFSPVSWTKIGTGRSRENISIDGWTVTKDGKNRPVTSEEIEHKRIWEYLGQRGVPVGVVNFLLTWPAYPVNGFMVATTARLSAKNASFPPNLLPEDAISDGEWTVARWVLSNKKDDARFLTFGLRGLDMVQHSLWKFVFPTPFGMEWDSSYTDYRDIVYDEYEDMDRFISRFGPEWNVILISDHGFTEKTMPNVSTVREYKSAPHITKSPKASFTTMATLNPLLTRLGYIDAGSAGTDYSAPITWCPVPHDEPQVLNETTYHVHFCIQDESLDPESVIRRLNAVEYRNGRHFFEDLHYVPERDVIDGRWRLFPSGVINQTVRKKPAPRGYFHEEVMQVFQVLALELPSGEPYTFWLGPEVSGTHPGYTNGIFIASGPVFADNGRLPSGTITVRDIAPTVLYMYGVPIPRGMDGEVVDELFTDQFNAGRSIQYANVSTKRNRSEVSVVVDDSRSEEYKERLRSLGYLQ